MLIIDEIPPLQRLRLHHRASRPSTFHQSTFASPSDGQWHFPAEQRAMRRPETSNQSDIVRRRPPWAMGNAQAGASPSTVRSRRARRVPATALVGLRMPPAVARVAPATEALNGLRSRRTRPALPLAASSVVGQREGDARYDWRYARWRSLHTSPLPLRGNPVRLNGGPDPCRPALGRCSAGKDPSWLTCPAGACSAADPRRRLSRPSPWRRRRRRPLPRRLRLLPQHDRRVRGVSGR